MAISDNVVNSNDKEEDCNDDDDDDVYEQFLSSSYSAMKLSPAQIAERHRERLSKESYAVSRTMLRRELYDESSRCALLLQCAESLDALSRRTEAVHLLRCGRFMEDYRHNVMMSDDGNILIDHGEDELLSPLERSALMVAVSKLLFKDNQKTEALQLVLSVCHEYATSTEQKSGCSVSRSDAEDAFYLAGWIHVHDDNHTEAYSIWSWGHQLLPGCANLERQHQKRACWDVDNDTDLDLLCDNSDNIGLEAFEIPPSMRGGRTPALKLFDASTQNHQLIFRTNSSTTPLMTRDECKDVLDTVDHFIATQHQGVWPTVRSSSVKTTDIAVEDVPELRPWLRKLLRKRIYPCLHKAFPRLADGSNLLDGRRSRMRVHDAFIVRYECNENSNDGCNATYLPEHSDTSAISLTLSLNDSFQGGGTWFESLRGDVIDADVGQSCIFAGPLRHAGYPITGGTRMILVLFLYVEDFHYGPFLSGCDDGTETQSEHTTTPSLVVESESSSSNSCTAGDTSLSSDSCESITIKPSGDTASGYVVYRETVELSNTLSRIDNTGNT